MHHGLCRAMQSMASPGYFALLNCIRDSTFFLSYSLPRWTILVTATVVSWIGEDARCPPRRWLLLSSVFFLILSVWYITSLTSLTCFHYVSGIADAKENTGFFSPSESCKTADLEHWSVDDYLTPGILFPGWFAAGGHRFSTFSGFPPVHNSRSLWPNDKVEHGKVAGWSSEWFSGEKFLQPSSQFSPAS